MSVETRRAERAPKTETEKLLQKEKTKAGLQAMAIGPVTGVLGLPSDILDLADMVNDAVAKYGEDTVLGQYSKLIKPSLDKVQEKYGREAFDRGFTELTGIKSDASNPPQMLGELISLGTLAKTGVKVAKTVGETFSDTYKGAKKLFEDSTMPPTSGSKLATVDDAPLPEIKETETLLQKPEKVDKTFQTPTTEDYGNLPIINPSIIGLQTEMGQKAIKQFENLEKTTNKTPEELFAETGVYRGPDKKLRYELDDRGAKLTNSIKKAFKNFDSDAKVEDLKSLNRVFTLEEVFDFPALYKQYDLGIKRDGVMYGPIKDLEIKFKKVPFNFDTLGGYDPVDDVIEINLNAQAFGSTSKKFPNIRIDKQTRQARIEATILHEIQHAIQQREGFFSGGNTKDRLAKINPNYEQDTKTNNAFLQKALAKLGKNKNDRFPIESFIREKLDLQDRASQGLEIGDFRKSLLERKKENLDNLNMPSQMKARYAKSYEKYYKNKKVLDDQNKKAYNEYREIYGERESRLVEKRFLKRKKLLEKDTGLKRLFGGRRDKTDTSLREDTEFVKELGGVSPKAKVVRDADGEIIDVVSSKSEISSKDFKPETIRVGEFPASQKRWFLDGDTVTLYHGTSKENLENVATSGLKGDAEGLVYTSPDVHSATGYASVKGGEAANLKGRPKLNVGDENRITLKYEIPKNEFLKLVGDPDKTQRSLTSKKKLFGKDSEELYNKTKDESASNYYEATEIRFKEGAIDKYLVGAVKRVRTPKVQQEMISVFPKPERMFPKGEAPKGGDYLNPATGEVITGKNVQSANIKINPNGRPDFKVSDDNVDNVGTVGKGNSQILTNLFKRFSQKPKDGTLRSPDAKGNWQWTKTPEGFDKVETVISVTHKGKHYYSLETDFTKGVNLKKYPDKKDEPKLRPTVVGQIELGQPIGEISVRGKPHKVYDKIKAFNKGGIAMKEQMELFQEGGLQEEGGTVDPVSGNEVPIGSTKEEVRDDIPAQLSEGEFVFPADVVRFIGLEKLMQLRQEAKAGLKKMEEMGQMGNSDEATLPDDIPFTIDDLDTREETEEEKVEMARGGVIQAQAGTFVNPNFGTFTRPSYVAPQFQMNQTPISTLPNTQQLSPAPVGGFTPTFYNVTPKPQTGPGSTFQDLIGRRPGQYDEFRKYVNESGMILNIPFKDGEPLYPVPEGYTYQDPEEVIVDDPSVVDVKPQTTRVVETQSDDGGDPEIDAGLGGARTTIGGIDYAVQYDFKGNVTGIANVANAVKSGRANFEKPTFEVASLISQQNKAQRGMLNTYNIATGKAKTEQEKAINITSKLNNIKDPISFTPLTERPDVLGSRKDTEKDVEKETKGKLEQDPYGIGKLGEFDTSRPDTKGQIGMEQDIQAIQDEALDPMDDFSNNAKSDIAANGGSKGIGFNSNGTTYSINNNGTFTHSNGTTTNVTDRNGKPVNAPSFDDVVDSLAADDKAANAQAAKDMDIGIDAFGGSGDSDGKSIVCTEMYRQTQLNDWSQAMKTWYVYQKKYLTNTHEIGYHWLFKPFVSGMKVNSTLTSIGAYFAKKRTQHLKHILTKGKAKDSLVGNVFCKIIHPIVYLVGLVISK